MAYRQIEILALLFLFKNSLCYTVSTKKQATMLLACIEQIFL